MYYFHSYFFFPFFFFLLCCCSTLCCLQALCKVIAALLNLISSNFSFRILSSSARCSDRIISFSASITASLASTLSSSSFSLPYFSSKSCILWWDSNISSSYFISRSLTDVSNSVFLWRASLSATQCREHRS